MIVKTRKNNQKGDGTLIVPFLMCMEKGCIEKTKNILSEKHRPQLEEYLCFLSNLGYEVTMDVLNSKDFGIPQSRERIYIIGVLKYE